MTNNYYHYLPWMRQGLSTAITPVDSNRAKFTVRLTINQQAQATEPITASLYGPGDILSFDPRLILKTEPNNFEPNFEPNYFPFIEFDRPDFPWIFTPVPAETDKLRPWIVLIVVEKRSDVSTVNADPQSMRLPILKIASDAQSDLPPLEEAWAWAHVQITTHDPNNDLQVVNKVPSTALGNLLRDQPNANLSRLLCPRKLKPHTSYIACVVPTYEAGRQAGLGLVVDAPLSTFSWDSSTTSIDLPMYHRWEFSTGEDGDFEALVRRLERRSLQEVSSDIGVRPLAVHDAKAGLPDLGIIGIGSALVVTDESPNPVEYGGISGSPPQTLAQFQTALTAILNGTAPTAQLPVILPPLYGQWHVAQRTIPYKRRDANWFRQLNEDPRYRIAAALGTQIVQKYQDELMTAAWTQAGVIKEANKMLQQAQLARAASTQIYQRHFLTLDPFTLLVMSGPAHSNVSADGSATGVTVSATVSKSSVFSPLLSSAFRRLTRSRGLQARHANISSNTNWTSRILELMNHGDIRINPLPNSRPQGMTTIDPMLVLGDPMPLCTLSSERLRSVFLDRFAPTLQEVSAQIQLANRIPPNLADAISQIVKSQSLSSEDKSILTDISNIATNVIGVKLEFANKEVATLQTGTNATSANIMASVMSALRESVELTQTQNSRIRDLIGNDQRKQQLLGSLRSDYLAELARNITLLVGALQPSMVYLCFAELQNTVASCEPPDTPLKPQLDVNTLRTQILAQLTPTTTIPARFKNLITAPGWEPDDPLDPVLVAPEFPTPMYKYLSEISSDWIMAGLDRVPHNTVALALANERFIEAFMVGLNHEMGRELLWRGYPTDQRGTYFRQFWDPSGRVPPPASAAEGYDIKLSVSDWYDPNDPQRNGNLGSHVANESGAPLVLLIRGELFQRYPRPTIYFASAQWKRDSSGNPIRSATGMPMREPDITSARIEQYPDFQADLGSDITLLGFTEVDETHARGDKVTSTTDPSIADPGYFIIIQEQLTEPRFGLDLEPPDAEEVTGTWRDLAWTHALDAAQLDQGAYIRLENPLIDFQQPLGSTLHWDKTTSTSAELAAITRQQSFRIAIHASDLLPVSVQP